MACGITAAVAADPDEHPGGEGRRPSVLPSGRPASTRPLDAVGGFPLAERPLTLPPQGLHPRTNELPGTMEGKLEQAFQVAIRKVGQVAACGALFEPLNRGGIEALSLSLYAGATPRQDAGWCRRGAVAVTAVGSPLIRLCPSFAALTPNERAITLIHEALHFSGLEEDREMRRDSNAPTPAQINRAVRLACRL